MGVFRFYQGGRLIGESHNLVTTAGEARIARYLAQSESGYAKAIGIGIGTTAATVADEGLEFEMARLDITQSGPNFIDGTVVFKARIPKELVMQIREAGIWSEAQASGTDGVVAFVSEEVWDAGTFETDNTRFGGEALRLSAANTITTSAVLLDLSGDFSEMSALSAFKLAAFIGDNNCGNITVRLRTDSSNYYQFEESSPASGYGIFSFQKKDAVATGSPDWSSINEVYVSITGSGGTTTVDFDALNAIRQDFVDPASAVLVSRSVLATPIEKTDVSDMEIEYSLGVTIS